MSMSIIMVNGVTGIWEPTDKFEFTGKWRCKAIYTYTEADVEFEVEMKFNWLYRWYKGIPKTCWIDSTKFVEVNVCE